MTTVLMGLGIFLGLSLISAYVGAVIVATKNNYVNLDKPPYRSGLPKTLM
ncbi:MAG: hypothetical protein AAF493_08220 [Pseudomonadota bacterium]